MKRFFGVEIFGAEIFGAEIFLVQRFLLKFYFSMEAKAQIANHRKTAIRLLGGIVN